VPHGYAHRVEGPAGTPQRNGAEGDEVCIDAISLISISMRSCRSATPKIRRGLSLRPPAILYRTSLGVRMIKYNEETGNMKTEC